MSLSIKINMQKDLSFNYKPNAEENIKWLKDWRRLKFYEKLYQRQTIYIMCSIEKPKLESINDTASKDNNDVELKLKYRICFIEVI